MFRITILLLCFVVVACKSGQAKNEFQTGSGAAKSAKTEDATKRTGKLADPDEDVIDPADAQYPVVVRKPILNPYEYSAFVANVESEHKKFGLARLAKTYKKKKYGNSVVEQRSGRKRLYDHNIFLRALLAGRLDSETYGNLQNQFKGGVFLDIGSAILFGEGADTVRDLYEDKEIQPMLTIVASDINDPGNKKTMYVDIYRQSGRPLPFPVVEIAMMMDRPEHFITPIQDYLKSGAGVILRSANAGPDLYYDKVQVQKHLRAAIRAFYDRPLIYLFNKYILYKPRKRNNFLVVGEIDDQVGTNHRKPTWETIDWSKRTFEEAIRLNEQHLTYTQDNL